MTQANEVTITVNPEGIELGGTDVQLERNGSDLLITTDGDTVNLSEVSEDTVSSAHHSKTDSAAELTDVSADFVSGAHHARYSDEEAQDAVAALLQAGTNITLNYDDTADTLTIDAAGGGGGGEYTDEQAQDAVAAALAGGTNVTVTYDDSTGTITVDGFSGDHAALSNITSNDHHSKTSSASELTDVSADSVADAHHTEPTAGTGLTDEGSNQFGMDVIASGSETLSSGAATVDTGVSTGTTATFMVAFGPSTSDADVAADIRADSASGTYQVDIQETDTSVGNPTVKYDIVRVR